MSDPIFHDETPVSGLAEIGRYARLQEARERGLVIAAMGRPHWVVRQGREYVLCVEAPDRDAAQGAVAEYDREEQSRRQQPPVEALHVPVFAVVMTVLTLLALYLAQNSLPAAWMERGVADDLRIRAGEWWRVLTALTLHGDVEHLVSNLSLGIFVAAFVYARFGVGVGLTATIFGGALGNLLNAWVHWHQPHRSIGSSTALFAGLGLLAGAELAARLAHEHTRSRWSLIVPLGAGMTFLSMFGGGGVDGEGAPTTTSARVDIMAHLLGLFAGVLVGMACHWAGAKRGWSEARQIAAGLLGAAVMGLAWWTALR